MTLPGSSLLGLSAWRYARQHPWQSWLSFLGIVLGVMMVVAIDLANNSANRSFALAVDSVNGSISHQIVGTGRGVPDEIFARLRTELGIRRSAPSLTGTLSINGEEFTLLGQDLFSELSLQRQRAGFETGGMAFDPAMFDVLAADNTVMMSQGAAARAGFNTGDLLQASRQESPLGAGQTTTLELVATLPSSDPLATEGILYTDIAVAQRVLSRQGYVDSIDLILNASEAEQVESWLPAGLTLVDARTRNDSLSQMTSAFHINLLAMSLLSLLVAALLIYNTVTLSVLRREHTLGIFRALGVSRREIYRLVLGEAALYGIIASAIGVLLGYLLGKALLDLVTAAIPDLNYRLNVTSFLVTPGSLLMGFGIGLGVTLLSAALPAWRATQAEPISLQQRARHDYRWSRFLPLLSYTGLFLLVAGFLLLQSGWWGLVGGFIALTLLIAGFCLLVPLVLSFALSLLMRLLGKRLHLPGRMSLRTLHSSLHRCSLAVAALSVAIAVTVGVGVMVDSFRNTVIIWLDQSFRGDIEITGANLDAELQDSLARLPGVTAVSGSIITRVESSLGQARLHVSELSANENYYLKEISEDNLRRFNQGEGVLISEPLAWLSDTAVGSRVNLATDRGMQEFPVLGIFYDYTPSQGMFGMHQSLYQQWWQEQNPGRLTLFTEGSGADLLETVQARLADRQQTAVFPNQAIRELTLTIFDRTFAITNVLRLLAIVIAFIGVFSALMALLLERSREYATLRACGMTPPQIAWLILSQTLLMGLFAGLLSLPLGLLMSDVLIDVINKRSFGWSMQHFLPQQVLIEAVILAVLAALLAGLYPALKSSRIRPALALREE